MRAVILAGGRGTRLHPLTTNIPKPLVPLFDKPVMEHAILLLKRHGIRDIIVTVGYRAGQIMEYFGNGERLGVRLSYYIEETPRGTAGGFRDLASQLDKTFLVISGDAVTDFDLSSAIDFHRKKKAQATLCIYDVADPSEFGLVQTDPDGEIMRFIEKPTPGEMFGRTVNTGIYVLEPSVLNLIPENSVFDFSRDLFPQLLRKPKALYAKRMSGYWCDVGNLAQYRDSHFAALTRLVEVNLPARRAHPGVWVGEGCRIDPSARICGPVFIGDGAVVEAGAFLGGFAVVGAGAKIGAGARIAQSVVGAGAEVSADAAVFGSVIAQGAATDSTESLANRILALEGEHRDIQPLVDTWHLQEPPADTHHPLWGTTEEAPASRLARPINASAPAA